MMQRSIALLALLSCAPCGCLAAQRLAHGSWRHDDVAPAVMTPPHDPLGRSLVHLGKWLTAAGTATFTVLGAEQHRSSRRVWDQLLDICRSAQDACDLGADGRYLRADAESLYQTSRGYDRRANRWLLGAQASLIATAALFIIDLHPGEGPDNIPFAPVRVGFAALPGAALVEMRVRL